MKVYNSNHGAAKKNTGVWYAVLAVLAVCVIGAIVAITIAVGGRDNASRGRRQRSAVHDQAYGIRTAVRGLRSGKGSGA